MHTGRLEDVANQEAKAGCRGGFGQVPVLIVGPTIDVDPWGHGDPFRAKRGAEAALASEHFKEDPRSGGPALEGIIAYNQGVVQITFASV